MKHLLTEEELTGDPEFMVAVIEAGSASGVYPDSEVNLVYVPERVMERILGVAKAYQLKFPEHASRDPSVRWVYRSTQVEWVIDELEFLHSLLNDQLLNGYISKMLVLASTVLSRPHKLELAFEGP
ncbi:hypothetical protein [Halopseudomonas salegens]|uniref:Uncharacterized protein n=1 Tax=Halopseudomonas salegens TaxID=1434072 RepID=A0A1H2HJ09_9GAMM|nr:hypothetical protein [Halopseudomonas salegens]SDU31776.1 hypothetical protein SAMN05216210_3075 [Halopseudomonas salegens]